jgi:hypothetical protein
MARDNSFFGFCNDDPAAQGFAAARSDNALEIHTTTDLINAIAKAIQNTDLDALDRLEVKVDEWLQMDDEREAQLNLIQSAYEMIEESSIAFHDPRQKAN